MTGPWGEWESNFIAQMSLLRERRGMTQTDLANRMREFGLPFHQQTVQRIESGTRPVRLNEAHLIANVLDVNLDAMTFAAHPTVREFRYAVIDVAHRAKSTTKDLADALEEWADNVIAPLWLLLSDLAGGDPVSSEPPADWEARSADLPSEIRAVVHYLERAVEPYLHLHAAVQAASQLQQAGTSVGAELPLDYTIFEARKWLQPFLRDGAKSRGLVRADAQTLLAEALGGEVRNS